MATRRQNSRQAKRRPGSTNVRALMHSAIEAGLIKSDATIQEVVNFAQQTGMGANPDYILCWDGYFFIIREF